MCAGLRVVGDHPSHGDESANRSSPAIPFSSRSSSDEDEETEDDPDWCADDPDDPEWTGREEGSTGLAGQGSSSTGLEDHSFYGYFFDLQFLLVYCLRAKTDKYSRQKKLFTK